MAREDDEENLLRSVALQNAQSILLARQRAEQDLILAKEALERKTEELAHSLSMMQATLESTTDGILVTDGLGKVTGFNQKFVQMWRLHGGRMEAENHSQLLDLTSHQFANPVQFRIRIEEIYASSPPESFDVLETADGRVIERFSKIQRIAERNAGRVWSFRDVTERKRAELELHQQSEWFRVTLGSIGDAVITVDNDCQVTFVNSVAEKLTGWQTSEAVGRKIGDVMRLVQEITRERAPTPIDRALREGVVVGLANHTSLIRRDGSEIPIEDSAAPIKNPAGETIGAVMVFHDVSERRQRETALAQSEERFRLMGQVVPQLLWTADVRGEIDYRNERWYAYTGQASEEATAAGWAAAAHPEDGPKALETWMRSIEAGEPCEVEYRLRQHDGDYRWFVCRAVPLRDDEGRIIRWYGSCTDFHQQKLTAEALREESAITERLHEVAKALSTELDLGKVVQIITDAGTRVTRAQFGAFFHNLLDGKATSANPYSLSGVSREAFEQLRTRARDLFGPTFRGEGAIRLADVRKDSRFGGNEPGDERAGDPPLASYLAVPVISRSGEVLGGLLFGHAEADVFTQRDETMVLGIAAQAAAAMDTARLYHAEQQARAAAEEANRAKDLFLAALSHELRTPLTPVIAILSSLRQDPDIPETLADDLETVRRNIELEARLIDDLLDLTRITRGKMELQSERVQVIRIIEDAINTCLPELKAKHLTLVRDFEEPHPTILADGARITQILWNLLKNSIKFTPEAGTITIRSRITPGPGAQHVMIEIQDTGIGIEPTQLGRVFEAFEQGDRKITRQFGGLGLGLAISSAIAESHGGSLTVASEGTGRGSTFTLALPLEGRDELKEHASVPGGLLGPAAEVPRRPGFAPRPLRLLLVEDHLDTAAILSRLLRRMGHEVVHAGTIGAAREAATKEMNGAGLDLVMSDLGLPDGSGLDLMRELSTTYGLRGIALSGFGMESDLAQSTAAGFSHHLIKPIDIGVLRNLLSEMQER
ncbi:MAG: PAS domain S-box protein [Verrucomicrobiales bacterium]